MRRPEQKFGADPNPDRRDDLRPDLELGAQARGRIGSINRKSAAMTALFPRRF
jgi:hypothetical protein